MIVLKNKMTLDEIKQAESEVLKQRKKRWTHLRLEQ